MPRPRKSLQIEEQIPAGIIPPQNLEAEQSVLGSLLMDQEAITKITDRLTPSDFYKTEHRRIFEAILELFETQSPIDVLTLSNKLEDKKQIGDVGGVSYLTSLVNSVPTASHVAQYAQIVHDKATLRRLISAANQISSFAITDAGNLDEVLDKSEQTLFAVSQHYLKQNFIPLKSVLSESFERLDKLHQDRDKLRGLGTGFDDLDNLLAGLQPSDVVVLAARPSMGKSSLALNIALQAAVKDGVPVGIFSLEMSKEQVVDRLICAEAEVDSWKLRTGNLVDTDFEKIGKAMGRLAEAQIFIDDSANTNVMEMRAKARRLQSEYGLGLLVVDYLQLMESHRPSDSRVQEISEISRSLKGLAKELNVPVLALSQLSRAVEMRSPKIPQLADLRESGAIEQDADVVIFIYRDEYYDKDTERKNIADILIRKHRNGPTGDVELYFHPEYMKFANLSKKFKDAEVVVEEDMGS